MRPIKVERAPRSVDKHDSSERKAILAELEARKREEGTTFYSGSALRQQGHTFFEADRDYYLKPVEGKPLVEVSAFSKYDESLLDFDGRTDMVCYYDWWYLDAQLRPIPGFSAPVCESLSDRRIFKARFEALQEQAAQTLSDRGRSEAVRLEPQSGQTSGQRHDAPPQTQSGQKGFFDRLFHSSRKHAANAEAALKNRQSEPPTSESTAPGEADPQGREAESVKPVETKATEDDGSGVPPGDRDTPIDRDSAGSMAGKVVIPDCMTEIEDGLFLNNRAITEVVIPGTVRRIGEDAFAACDTLERVEIGEGVEEIGNRSFKNCGISKIAIPASVRQIGYYAFGGCERLEVVTLAGRETRISHCAFGDCPRLREIVRDPPLDADQWFCMRGMPFLIVPHDDSGGDRANLNHTASGAFKTLTDRFAASAPQAVYDLAEFFDAWSKKPGASPFYRRAANFWRYQAYRQGVPQAEAWFRAWFRDNPRSQLESVVEAGTFGITIPFMSGALLNELGCSFFNPDLHYRLARIDGGPLLELSAYESSDGPDEDGYGREEYYDWWYLDENLQPIPGIEKMNAAYWERNTSSRFKKAIETAQAILKVRKAGGTETDE